MSTLLNLCASTEILWFLVPFSCYCAALWEAFGDKFLRGNGASSDTEKRRWFK